MKKILYIFLTILLLTPSFVNAQESVSDIIGSEQDDIVQTITEEQVDPQGDIDLTLPEQTDNPSYIITFIDPSEDEEGVQIEIDNDRYIDIQSPYTLPALGIGEHTLKFKYIDDEGATQTLERSLIVIPRAPIINSPIITESSVDISGTGLANSELLLTISTGAKTYQKYLDISDTGAWSYTLTEELTNGIYSVQALTRKYGYASNFSDTLVFEFGNITTAVSKEENPLSFSFKQLNMDVLTSLTSSNLDLLLFSIGIFILGIVVGTLGITVIRNGREKKFLGSFREKINGKEKEDNELTLRELFEKEGKKDSKVKDTPKPKDEKKENKKEEKETKEKVEEKKDDEKKTPEVISKDEFLEVYKDQDPDNDKGKEKKKFSISLTSKKK